METADWQHIPITVSIGVAAYASGDNVESLLSLAAGFLYKAKARGRNYVLEMNKVPLRTSAFEAGVLFRGKTEK